MQCDQLSPNNFLKFDVLIFYQLWNMKVHYYFISMYNLLWVFLKQPLDLNCDSKLIISKLHCLKSNMKSNI